MKKLLILILFIPIVSFGKTYTYSSYEIPNLVNVKSIITFLPNKMVQIELGSVINKYYILQEISKDEYILSKGIENYHLTVQEDKAIFTLINSKYKITFKNYKNEERVIGKQDKNTGRNNINI